MVDDTRTDPPPRRIEPPVTETSQPFWDATRDQRFLLQWCVDCNRPIWFPREVCPRCMGLYPPRQQSAP